MKELKVKLTFLEEVLGTANNNPDVHGEYIASKAPDAKKKEEEIASIGVDEYRDKQMTVFPKLSDGRPFVYDYQIKGFFKDTCSAMRKVPNSKSSKIKAFKKDIDGLIFIQEREIPFIFDGELGNCQRPLRASTMQGERVALADSETVPAGATIAFTIVCLADDENNHTYENLVKEWLDYGQYRGLGQWRNSGKGRFTWQEIE